VTLEEYVAKARIEFEARRICEELGFNPEMLVMQGIPTQVRDLPDTYYQLPVFPLWQSYVKYVTDESKS
jgi:hypothetical protein